MTKLLERGARWVLALLVLPWLLAACGPGGGGTGTGPVNALMQTYSGTSIQGAISSSAPGNCAPQCGAADLVVEEVLVRFASDCRLFTFAGAWSLDANGAVSLHGTLATTAGTAKVVAPASLDLQFSERQVDSARATAVLRDESGRAILGPFNLQRGAAIGAAFGSCPDR